MQQVINWFRDAVPYIKSHRNKIFVILLSSLHQANSRQVLLDIACLQHLGVKVIMVYGVRKEIDDCLRNSIGYSKAEVINNLRVTDESALQCVKQANSMVKLEIEAILSENRLNKIVSGNFITAKPIGIIDGVDFKHTGTVRKIDVNTIKEQLKTNMVLLSPLGYASTGEVFNLSAEEVAGIAAVKLSAHKLIILHSGEDLKDSDSQLVTELTTLEARQIKTNYDFRRYLDSAIYACEHNVDRVHILNTKSDGVILRELFGFHGSGTMISTEPYETTRKAVPGDVRQIHELIKPLISEGVLVDRSKETVANNIDDFYVMELDDKIIGTIALLNYPEKNIAEIACVAIHHNYQKKDRGKHLLRHIEVVAKKNNMSKLFVMSTQAGHWFIEQGYEASELADLPLAKQEVHNFVRNSRPYIKQLA